MNIINNAHKWAKENTALRKGNDGSSCMIQAYIAGCIKIIEILQNYTPKSYEGYTDKQVDSFYFIEEIIKDLKNKDIEYINLV